MGHDQARASRPDTADQAELPSSVAPDQARRQQLADRLAKAHDTRQSLRDLHNRANHLRPGHPSSPTAEDGSRRPAEASLKDLERPEPPLTDAQWADHLHDVTDLLGKATADGQSTDLRHTGNSDHDKWSLERTRLHKQIIAEVYELAAHVPCDRQAIIAGGLPGAGKTTVLDKHAGIDRSAYLTINPDDFKELLARRGAIPEISGLSPMEASSLAHEESSYLARQLAHRALADGKNVIWDVTMSSTESTARRIGELRTAGYMRVDGIYVDIPIDVSIARAEARHRGDHDRHLAGDGPGGRTIPPDLTRRQADAEYGSANRRAFEGLKQKFDNWSVFDNSGDGEAAVLTEWGGRDEGRPASIQERQP